MKVKKLQRVNKRNIFIWALGVLLFLAIAFGTWNFFSKTTLFFNNGSSLPRETVRRLIDGVLVERESEKIKRPVAIIIDNSADGQPFQGPKEARLIYETIAEGNITRILAIYDGGALPEIVGPVRSVRPYFASWASEVNAILVHVGGSPDGLKAVEGYDHINEFYDGRFFSRDSKRVPPHSIFTSSKLLRESFEEKRFAPTTTFEMWSYADVIPQTAGALNIDVNFSINEYNVRWEYNDTIRVYERSRNGIKENLFADSIVVMTVPTKVVDRELRRNLALLGEGRAWIFTRGGVTVGKWVKKSLGDRTQFINSDGTLIPLAPGITWVEVIDDEGRLRF